MSPNEPVDARVRLAICRWPMDAPRGSVTTFCIEHGISRKTFYAIRARARAEGQAAALQPRSRRPKSSPKRIPEDVKREAVAVRAALEESGLDHGPISVHDKMIALGMNAPSVAALARIFREMGVARLEPKKKPRSAYRRFVYPAPNACWQLDATEYVLTGGRKCVVFQLEDDHSRLAIASHVANSETALDALAVFKKGVKAHGAPQRLLTDNGLAMNPARRGVLGQLVRYATSLGVEAMTGKPYKPSTQGKNERFHQTLFRWLDKQPLAASIEQLQEQVDRFDVIYNTERPHQGLPGRITPQQAWDATPLADPPVPDPGPMTNIAELREGATGHREATVRKNGTVQLLNIRWQISSRLAGQRIHITWDPAGVVFSAQNGELIAEHPWPPEGTPYVSNGLPPGRRKQPPPSPMS
ncbi:integrase core domain-containing protein [Pseudoclavibacter helvolus]|uniref:integrase core domain-containing protein n=1 Tax=Pseudoclavibacter helvolus TaxID=255205 RepID=UPI003C742871